MADTGTWERKPPSEEDAQETTERRSALVKTTRIVWLVAGVLEAMIGLRVLLKLIAANPHAGFTTFVYGMTQIFLVPFQGLTATPSANGAVLEIPSLFAMLIYGLLAWIVVKAVWIIFDKGT